MSNAPAWRVAIIGAFAYLRMASADREPPTWMPAVAIGSIPLAIATVAGFGLMGPGWALGAALMAVFFVVLLFALWATPTTTKGFAAASLIAGSAAIVLTVTLVRLTALADRLHVTRPGTTVPTPPPVVRPPTGLGLHG
jgi:hypothetical protein